MTNELQVPQAVFDTIELRNPPAIKKTLQTMSSDLVPSVIKKTGAVTAPALAKI